MAVSILRDILSSTWLVTRETAHWLLIGFLVAGLVREFIPMSFIANTLGRQNARSVLIGSVLGAALPLCCFGGIPVGIGLYRSGAGKGASLAFLSAATVINPIGVVIALGMLGWKFTLAYVLVVLAMTTTVGFLIDAFAGSQPSESLDRSHRLPVFNGKRALTIRLRAALKWSFIDMGADIGPFILVGLLFAGILTAAIPQGFVDNYLGRSYLVSTLAMVIFGFPMYVCAVGTVPFAAAMVAKGIFPGSVITYLVAGAATNLPEFLLIYRKIDKRAAFIYISVAAFVAVALGWVANLWLYKPNYYLTPEYQQAAKAVVGQGILADCCSALNIPLSSLIFVDSAIAMFFITLALIGTFRRLRKRLARRLEKKV